MDRMAGRAWSIRSLMAGAALVLMAQMPQVAQAQNCLSNTTATPTGARTFPGSQCGGLEVRLLVPPMCAEQGAACLLEIDLNGVAVQNVITERNDRFEQRGLREGNIVIRAQGPTIAGIPALRQDDPMRIIGIIEEAKTKLNVNPNNIHIAGFSQGAGAALTISCMRPDLIASAAFLAPAGGAPASCTQTGPKVAMMFIQSSMDQLVNPQRTAGTVQAFVTGMGLRMADAKEIKRGEQGILIREFMNTRGQVLRFFTSNLTGASVGGGHCYPGSFETQTGGTGQALGQIVSTLQFGCTDTDMIRFSDEVSEFRRMNPKVAGQMTN